MGSSAVGDPLWAVLIPPALARFRELVELGDAPLAVDFTGFNKYVLLSDDRVFLFLARRATSNGSNASSLLIVRLSRPGSRSFLA
jgi:hypothetical protein